MEPIKSTKEGKKKSAIIRGSKPPKKVELPLVTKEKILYKIYLSI